jgi:hypothetical protein
MTSAEVTTYNLGVRAVLDAARRSAEDLSRAAATWKPTRVAFAIAALDEFADAGEALLIPGRNGPNSGEAQNPPLTPVETAEWPIWRRCKGAGGLYGTHPSRGRWKFRPDLAGDDR